MCCNCICGYITRGVIEFIDLFIIIISLVLTIYDILYINDTFNGYCNNYGSNNKI